MNTFSTRLPLDSLKRTVEMASTLAHALANDEDEEEDILSLVINQALLAKRLGPGLGLIVVLKNQS